MRETKVLPSPADETAEKVLPSPADETAEDREEEHPRPEPPRAVQRPAELVAADLLVEDVSIDGMCGVY